jgi:type I restriction enzyme S subunit
MSWGWTKYGDLCSIVKNGISEKPTGNDGTPIFRISAVRPLFFDMCDIRYIDNSNGRFNANYLERGDLVFTRYNGSRHYVGVCAEYRSDEKRLFPDKLVQTRLISKDCLSSSYFEKALNCGATRKFLESKIRTTAGQSGVSGDDIKFSPVPICCINEQFEIVGLLESKLTVIDQFDQSLVTSLQQAEALRQSILKKAFSGQLVPQDPNDEPASVLLERIQAEKVKLNIQTPSNRGKKTVTKHRSPSC